MIEVMKVIIVKMIYLCIGLNYINCLAKHGLIRYSKDGLEDESL